MYGYSEYTKELVGEIEKYRDKGIMYQHIVDYLKGRGFKSSRGKELSAKLIERMLKKKIESDKKRKVKLGDIEDLEIIETSTKINHNNSWFVWKVITIKKHQSSLLK